MDLFIIIIIFIWLFFGYAASTIASSKGRNRAVWFCAGLIFGPFALDVYLLPPLSQQKGKGVSSSPSADKISLENGTKKCPMCAEMIKLEAQKCRFCGHLFDPGEVARQVEEAQANLQARLDIGAGWPQTMPPMRRLGCAKVVKTGAGAALLRDRHKIAAMIQAVRKSCPLPLTVKIRIGWSPSDPVASDVAHIAEDCGADGVTVHPRFATQSFSTPADWSWIRKVKETVKIPVIGNGDVFDASAALRMMAATGCDGVMIGRGAVRNPWVFRQIQNLERGLPVTEPGLEDRKSFVMDHYRFLCDP